MDLSAIDAARRFVALFVFVLNLKRECLNMTYPDLIRAQLDQAISTALHDSTFAPHPLSRKGKVTTGDIIKALIFMEGGSLHKELREAHLPITAPAFIQHRHKIPSIFFGDILTGFYEQFSGGKTYQGYRIMAVDGTTVNMARDPKSKCFVLHPGAPQGYCQMHANPLYDVLNKTYCDCVLQPQPQQDEVGALNQMLVWRDFTNKTLIVADRAYASYNTFAMLQNTLNVDFLIRVKQGNGAMRPIAELPMMELDKTVSFVLTTTQTNEDKEKGRIFLQTHKNDKRQYSDKTKATRWSYSSPYPMTLRVVRVLLDTGEYETLATSLPPSFTAAQIKELYHARWGIETAFRELKYNYGLVNLHGRSEEFVRQEIYASLIMASVCARIINEVVVRQSEGTKYQYAVNQKMAVYLCKKFFRTPGADGEQLMRDIARYTEPVRPGRADQRNLHVKGFPGFVYRVAA